jgi:tRNA A37 methylthiotransferase MiaB
LAFWSLSETACCVSMKRRWRSAFTSSGTASATAGETEEEFEELLTWLKEAKLERVGCFQYEPVRGARWDRRRR